jgi:hypothetical protein
VAQPLRRVESPPEDPPLDPGAVDRAYHYHRARRNARIRRKREKSRASLRFAVMVFLLLVIGIVLLFTIWHEIQKVFGL